MTIFSALLSVPKPTSLSLPVADSDTSFTHRTLFVLPPTVDISALTTFASADFRACIMSNIISGLSSQDNVALIRPVLSQWLSLSSSVSLGNMSFDVVLLELSFVSSSNAASSSAVVFFSSFTRRTASPSKEALSV